MVIPGVSARTERIGRAVAVGLAQQKKSKAPVRGVMEFAGGSSKELINAASEFVRHSFPLPRLVKDVTDKAPAVGVELPADLEATLRPSVFVISPGEVCVLRL